MDRLSAAGLRFAHLQPLWIKAMLAASIQQSFAPAYDRTTALQSAGAVPPQGPAGLLIAASQIQPGDHVKVIGRSVVNHLVALARCGCASATSVHPSSLFAQRQAADVLWIIGVDDIETILPAALRAIGTPRVVAIELPPGADWGKLQPVIRQLTGMGLVTCTTHDVADRLIFVASRPVWLQRVI
jgi:hypothetical protein